MATNPFQNFIDCEDVLSLYNQFTQEAASRNNEKQYLTIIHEKYGSLHQLFEQIDQTPITDKRNHFFLGLEDRGVNFEEVLQDSFSSHDIEEIIQRNIFYTRNTTKFYNDVIGIPIGLEVCVKANSKKGIDLITYKEENGKKYLYLIELKRCATSKIDLQKRSCFSANHEPILRAMLEISTYTARFQANFQDGILKEEVKKAILDAGIPISDEEIDHLIIQKALLIPAEMLDSHYPEVMEELQNFKLFTIALHDHITTVDWFYGNGIDKANPEKGQQQLFSIQEVSF